MVKKGDRSEVGCSYATRDESATPLEQLRPLFEERTVPSNSSDRIDGRM
jgi:hypothetical protein